jgi:hypothetical protein
VPWTVPGVPWTIPEVPWTVPGVPWTIPGVPWTLPGAPWMVLEVPLDRSGVPWTVLSGLLHRCGVTCSFGAFSRWNSASDRSDGRGNPRSMPIWRLRLQGIRPFLAESRKKIRANRRAAFMVGESHECWRASRQEDCRVLARLIKPNGLPKTTTGTRHQIALEPLFYQVPMLFRESWLTAQPRICMTKV